VEAASENYFGKSAAELNLAECAILAGLPQAPSRYSPFRHSDKAKQRQNYVLTRMVAEGYITDTEAQQASAQSLDIKPRRNLFIEEMPFYTEHVRRYIESRYGLDMLYSGGVKIHTAVSIAKQKIAQEEVDAGLRDLDKRQGYRGPVKQIRPDEIESFSASIQNNLEEPSLKPGMFLTGVVTEVNNSKQAATVRVGRETGILSLSDMKWARKPNPDIHYQSATVKRVSDVLKPGDVIQVKIRENPTNKSDRLSLTLEQTPKVQSAILCMETGTGQIKAMVGGRDFRESQYNRAIQSRRQPGSAFKPLIYAAAIDRGYTPATIMLDSPIEFQNEETDPVWAPRNYDRKFYGRVLFRHALEKSLNVVTVKILQDIGLDYAINYAKKMGISSPIEKNLSISLGSSGASLLEMLMAYSVFANGGERVEPVFITRIEDRHGNVLEENKIEKVSVMDKRTAFIMTNLLEGVVKNGTGRRVRALNRPVAGKTGTTSNLNDAWFIGFTPQYVTGVWVGFDSEASLGRGETGAAAAIPIWLGYMKRILENVPASAFPVPEGIVFVKIDSDTGMPAGPDSTDVIYECFKEGPAPESVLSKPDSEPASPEPEELFKSDI
jgi:penicillin-binding protein 1A